MAEEKRSRRKMRGGTVVSAKMDKTVVVLVERLVQHPLYKKYIKRRTKLYAHERDNVCKTGDTVRIIETKPTSKLKRWRVQQVLKSTR